MTNTKSLGQRNKIILLKALSCGSALLCLALPSCSPSFQEAGEIAQSEQVSVFKILPWTNAGIEDRSGWISAGVNDPNTALQWITLYHDIETNQTTQVSSYNFSSNSQSNDVSPPIWVAPLISAGFSPQQAEPFLLYLYSIGDQESSMAQTIIAIQPYYKNGYSIAKSVYLQKNNIPLDQVTNIEKEINDYREKIRNIVNSQCNGTISDPNLLFQMSPYDLEGKCFPFGNVPISQWIDQDSALAFNNSIELDFPSGQQQSNIVSDSLIRGEKPFVYTDASGTQMTVPRAQVIIYLDPTFEQLGIPPK